MDNNEFDQKSDEDAFKNHMMKSTQNLKKLATKKLIISLIGSVNAGKSKTINALTGVDYTEVKVEQVGLRRSRFMN